MRSINELNNLKDNIQYQYFLIKQKCMKIEGFIERKLLRGYINQSSTISLLNNIIYHQYNLKKLKCIGLKLKTIKLILWDRYINEYKRNEK